MPFPSTTARHTRLISAALAAAYLFMAVIVALHHHPSPQSPAGPFGSVTAEQEAVAGQHSALDCPVLQYAQHAFLAIPTIHRIVTPLTLTGATPVVRLDHLCSDCSTAHAVRGPPLFS